MLILNYSTVQLVYVFSIPRCLIWILYTPFVNDSTYIPACYMAVHFTLHTTFVILYISTFYICFVIEEALLNFRFQCLWAYRCG
jgi:hypothetical protein